MLSFNSPPFPITCAFPVLEKKANDASQDDWNYVILTGRPPGKSVLDRDIRETVDI